MIFAGLWESWRSPEGEIVESCTILTTASNSLIRTIHERMPVILGPGGYETWFSRESTWEQLTSLLQPYPSDLLGCYPVSDLVNSPRNDTPDCLTPVLDRRCSPTERG